MGQCIQVPQHHARLCIKCIVPGVVGVVADKPGFAIVQKAVRAKIEGIVVSVFKTP
ncbi:hypothetical protein GCM10008940_28970 [Microbulbifer agarilyticus]